MNQGWPGLVWKRLEKCCIWRGCDRVWSKSFEVSLVMLTDRCGRDLDKETSAGWVGARLTEMRSSLPRMEAVDL